ncbi:MAG: hypothetical protein Q7K37_08915, partial [Dehalococcoidia bacterium]|nr:hypothetical protein [Dehalococcoidia bacterium]
TAARGSEVTPREQPAPAAAPKPKGWWENRDPNDPFVRLERDRAAARDAALAAREAARTAAPAAASITPAAAPAPTPASAEPTGTDATAASSEQKPDEAIS